MMFTLADQVLQLSITHSTHNSNADSSGQRPNLVAGAEVLADNALQRALSPNAADGGISMRLLSGRQWPALPVGFPAAWKLKLRQNHSPANSARVVQLSLRLTW